METLSTNPPAAVAPGTPLRLPVAGGLLSLIGWAMNTARAATAAIWGPIVLLVLCMDDSGGFIKQLFSSSTLIWLAAPLLIGSCLVFAGNRLAGRRLRRCIIEGLAAGIVPPVLAFIAAVLVIRFAH